MSRKTDFFRTLTEESRVGFPPGVAENMIRCYFMKYNRQIKDAEKALENQKQEAPVEKPRPVKKPEVKKVPKPKPPKPTTQEQWQKESDSHNGAVRDNYAWTQSFEDIDVTVPTKVTNSRLVRLIV